MIAIFARRRLPDQTPPFDPEKPIGTTEYVFDTTTPEDCDRRVRELSMAGFEVFSGPVQPDGRDHGVHPAAVSSEEQA